MDENPYLSPQSPTNDSTVIPAWRWAIALLLFVIGVGFCVVLPGLSMIEALFFSGFAIFNVESLGMLTVVFATGVGAIWLGWRVLRRKSKTAAQGLD